MIDLMTMIKKYKFLILIFLTIFVVLIYLYVRNVTTVTPTIEDNLPLYTSEVLKQYDGLDLNKPVYIAYDGYVYDVTPGRDDFYNAGKDYHYLAGKDSTTELNIAGGSIIKRKYKIVGIYK